MDMFRVTLMDEERVDLERLVSVGKGAARRLTTPASCSWPMSPPGRGEPTTPSPTPSGAASAPSPASASGSSPRT